MKKFKVVLSSVGNIDKGQDPTAPLYGVENKIVEVSSLEEASSVCQSFIMENELGGGNWDGGYVYNEKGIQVAYISYNGRIWTDMEEPSYVDNRNLYGKISKNVG